MASTTRIDELKKKFDENPRRYFAPLANEFRKAGDIEQAILICEEFLPQQPGHMSGHIVYGQALYEAGRMPESRTVFETALGLDPENLIALRHLGDIALGQGDPAAARSWYRRVLDADPRNEEIQALIATLPADAVGQQDTPIIAEDDFDLSETLSAPPSTETVGVQATEIEKEEPALQASDDDLGDTHPFDIPVIPAQTPPPLPSSELIDGFSLHGFDSPQESAAEAPSAPAEGLESTSFEPPAEQIAAVPDLDDSLDSGVPSFEAPKQSIAAIDGLQGSGGDTHAPDVDDEITHEFPAAERLVVDDGLVLPPQGDPVAASAHYGSEAAETPATSTDSDLLDFEMPDSPPSLEREMRREEVPSEEVRTDEARADEERAEEARSEEARSEEAPPVELPPSVIAAEADLIDAGETPAPAFPSDAEMDAAAHAAPAPFVTETMAELYLAQGFREQALAVYAQLLAANPADDRLQGLVASLKAPQAKRGSEPTAREFFARMAARRPGTRGAAAIPPSEDDFADAAIFSEPAAAAAEEEPAPEDEAPEFLDLLEEEPAPPTIPDSSASDVAPAIERAAAMRTPNGSVDALFGNRPPRTSEDSAASALAQAFGATAEAEPQIVGRPARAAAAELSLDSVFRDGPARPPRTSQSFSFDQFFTGGASAAGTENSIDTATPRSSSEIPPSEPPAEKSADEIQQFNSWLQGLKPR
jgi:tetratricopeptide (TPR) repeat protein